MTIELNEFDQIISPGMPLFRLSHRFKKVLERYDSIDARSDLREKITMLAPGEAESPEPGDNEAHQADEGLRRVKLKQHKAELAKYPELNLNPSARYIRAADLTSKSAMRHRKAQMFNFKNWQMQRRIKKANVAVRITTEAYAKAEHDGVSPQDLRKATQNMQRALKHQQALTGTYRPRIQRQE